MADDLNAVTVLLVLCLKFSYTTVFLIQCIIKAAVRNFLDLEAVVSDDHSTDGEIVRILTTFYYYLY